MQQSGRAREAVVGFGTRLRAAAALGVTAVRGGRSRSASSRATVQDALWTVAVNTVSDSGRPQAATAARPHEKARQADCTKPTSWHAAAKEDRGFQDAIDGRTVGAQRPPDLPGAGSGGVRVGDRITGRP